MLKKLFILLSLLSFNIAFADIFDDKLEILENFWIHGVSDTQQDIVEVIKEMDLLPTSSSIDQLLSYYQISVLLLMMEDPKYSKENAMKGLEVATNHNRLGKKAFFNVVLHSLMMSKEYIPQNQILSLQKIVEKSGNNFDTAVSYLELSRINGAIGNFYQQLVYVHVGIETLDTLDKSVKNIRLRGEFYNELGLYFLSIHDYKNAQLNLHKALEQFELVNNKTKKGMIIFNLGIAYNLKGNHQKASENFMQVINLKKKLNEDYGLGLGHMYYASSIINTKQYELACSHLEKAIPIFKKLQAHNRLATIYLFQAKIFNEMGQKKKVINSIKLSLSLTRKYLNPIKKSKIYKQLFMLLKGVDDIPLKLEFMDAYFNTQDAIMNEIRNGVVAKAQANLDLSISKTKSKFLSDLDKANKDKMLIQQQANKIQKYWIFGLLLSAVLLFFSVFRQVKISKTNKKLARLDTLTGLMNRRAFFENLIITNKELKINGKDAYMLIFSIDNFKTINDTYGHTAGDGILVQLGRNLGKYNNETDYIARTRGDEFALIYYAKDPKDACNFSERLLFEMASIKWMVEDRAMKITISIGVSEITEYETLHNVFTRTDKLMYFAKSKGSNKIESNFLC